MGIVGSLCGVFSLPLWPLEMSNGTVLLELFMLLWFGSIRMACCACLFHCDFV
jgi:hypothetical protein